MIQCCLIIVKTDVHYFASTTIGGVNSTISNYEKIIFDQFLAIFMRLLESMILPIAICLMTSAASVIHISATDPG